MSRNHRSALLFALLISVLSISCGSARLAQPICAPGSTQLCLCSASSHGVQTCDANGRAWSTCTRCEHVEYAEPYYYDDEGCADECECGCVDGAFGGFGVLDVVDDLEETPDVPDTPTKEVNAPTEAPAADATAGSGR
jgi:hypothetical protein